MIVPHRVADAAGVARHYDELDSFYRDVWGEHLHHGYWKTRRESPAAAVEGLTRELANELSLRPGNTVCDVGCGYGGTSRLLAREFGVRVTGVTVSSSQHQYAVQASQDLDSVNYMLCNWLENDFSDGSFDALISIECLSHIEDKPRFFQEVARVLKPGGRAAMAVWLAAPDAGRFSTEYLLRPICEEGRLPGMATSPEVASMISEAGLQLDREVEIGRNVRKTWRICARRLAWKVCTQGRYRAVLLDRSTSNRIFALTLFRILTAYQTGAMQYGLFTMSKALAAPDCEEQT
ncbi:SAM-dependent methyltransferase [Rubinisphaera margarita]|uniref:SAM-dependent methyltransferase n=1 Tax=Rubinisphaera margarita TaxID=2909586 RepID=UPI001EE98D79|nr:class I SAM-dependent methyltransferase [Rubinisphaera margarita]MCG6158181.1 class I SAM-dependent methyltransferase [Rubinisphaera margarita]